MPSAIARVRLLRWLVWRWAVLAIGRPADDVSIVKLPEDLPVSVRPTTDGLVAIAVRHDDDVGGSAGRLADADGLNDVSNLISVGERGAKPSPPGGHHR